MNQSMVEHWISTCRQGDSQAFASLVGAFQQKVFGLCWQYLREYQAARDATADVFCKAYAALDRFDPSRPFGAWLLGIASHHLLQIKRTERRRGVCIDGTQADWVDEGPSPEEELLHNTERQEVESALTRIPDRYRLVLHLRFYEDLSYEEMARALNVSPGTIGSLVLRAKGLMRKELAHMRRSG